MVNLAEAEIGTPRTMPRPKPAAAIYARVSTDAQAEKQTIDVQLDACRAYCTANGYEVAAEFKDDGVSGTIALQERPAGRALISAIDKGEAEIVVIYCVDRLSRENETGVPAYNMLRRKTGDRVEFVLQSFDDTPEGKLQFHLFIAIAEYERDIIARRLRLGRERAAREKKRFSCSNTAFGYDSVDKKLVINETEAAVVRRVFEMYIGGGFSYRSLAAQLNSEGVPTKTGKVHSTSISGRHRGWYDSGVERLLRNPIYKGEAFFNKTHGSKARPEEEWLRIDCPRIVDDKTWNAARRRARRNLKRTQLPKDSVSRFLLSGLLKCHCGHAMYGVTMKERYRYFYCQGQRHYGTPCHSKAINATAIEEKVLDHIIEAFRDPERVLAACDDYAEQQRAAEGWSEGQMERLKTELAAAEAKRQRAIGLYTDGTISKAQLNIDLKRIDDDNKGHRDELDRMKAAARQRKTAKEAEKAAWAMASRVKDIVGELTLPEKKELVRASVEMVTVHSQHEIDIECILPTEAVKVTAGDLPPSCYNRHVWNPGP